MSWATNYERVNNVYSGKLPNMSELMGVDENFAQSDDEYVDFDMNKSPQPPTLKVVDHRSSSLHPVSEFQDDEADVTDLDFVCRFDNIDQIIWCNSNKRQYLYNCDMIGIHNFLI